MPRKSAQSLEQARNKIKKDYKRGRKTERRIVSEAALSEVELAVKKEAACFLKAADFSYTYIADALNTTQSIVKHWFEDAKMVERVGEISIDYIEGAVKLLKSYAVELVEMLVEIARTTSDDKVALQAITEALDRIGITKVNKSESAAVSVSKNEIDITDKSGLVAALRDAPPEVQAEAAEKMEALLALTAEHTDRSVTHG